MVSLALAVGTFRRPAATPGATYGFFLPGIVENSLAGASASDVIFRFQDDQGVVHLVHRLADVPVAYRAKAERLTLAKSDSSKTSGKPLTLDRALGEAKELGSKAEALGENMVPTVRKNAQRLERELGDIMPFVHDLHAPSLAVGAAVPLLAIVTWSLIRGRLGRPLKLVFSAGVIALLGSAYLGWMQGNVKGTGGGLSTPAQLVQEAKDARSQMQRRQGQQQRVLRDLERDSQ